MTLQLTQKHKLNINLKQVKFNKRISPLPLTDMIKALDGLTISGEMSPVESITLEKKLIDNHLSTYAYNKNDFLIMRNKENELIGAGRIYKLPLDIKDFGEDNYELGSLFIEEDYRGYGLGTQMVESLLEKFHIEHHDHINNLYLGTSRTLADFYRKHGFKELDYGNYPKRFEETLKYAQSRKIDAVIMKYHRNEKETSV